MGRERDLPLSLDWGALAPTYDLQLPLERAAVRSLVDLLAPRPGERMLDVGTGTGAVLRELVSRPDRPRDVVGVDRTPEMLERVPPLPTGWRLLESDVSSLPLANGSVDVVSASYLLHVLTEDTRHAALLEVLRVLRPGGRVGALVPALPRGALLRPYAAALAVLASRDESAFGLAVVDAGEEMTRAGLRVGRCRYTTRGYPSLCLVAHRPG